MPKYQVYIEREVTEYIIAHVTADSREEAEEKVRCSPYEFEIEDGVSDSSEWEVIYFADGTRELSDGPAPEA